MDEEKKYFESFGEYGISEAKRLLKRLKQAKIEFRLGIDDTQIRKMNPVKASVGGTFGRGVTIKIFIHERDMEKAVEIRKKVLGI